MKPAVYFVLGLALGMAMAQQEAAFEWGDGPRDLRRNQEEITNTTYYKENIRHDYFNISSSIEDSRMRSLLKELISFKNRIPRYNLSFYPIQSGYDPDTGQYVQGLVYVNLTTIYIAFLVLLTFIVFVSCRVCCNRCGATLTNYKFQIQDHFKFKCGLFTSIVVFTLASITALTGEIGYYTSIRHTAAYMQQQAANLTEDAQLLWGLAQFVNEIGPYMDDYYEKYGYELEVDEEFLEDTLLNQTAFIYSNTVEFEQFNQRVQTIFLSMVLLMFLVACLLIAMNLWAFMKSRFFFATASGISFYFMTFLALILMVYNSSAMFYIFDWCEEILDITDENDIPTYGTGLASYLSCLPTLASQGCTSFGYSLYIEYMRAIQLANVRLTQLGYDEQVKDFVALDLLVAGDSDLSGDEVLKNWYLILAYLEQALHIILNMVNCKQFIMFALETNADYCNKGFKYAITFYVGEWFWVFSFAFFAMIGLRLGQHIKFRTGNGGLVVTDFSEQKMSKQKKQEVVRQKIRKQQEQEEKKKQKQKPQEATPFLGAGGEPPNYSVQQRHHVPDVIVEDLTEDLISEKDKKKSRSKEKKAKKNQKKKKGKKSDKESKEKKDK